MTSPPPLHPSLPHWGEGEGGWFSDFSSSKLRIEMVELKAGAKSVSLEQRRPQVHPPSLSLYLSSK